MKSVQGCSYLALPKALCSGSGDSAPNRIAFSFIKVVNNGMAFLPLHVNVVGMEMDNVECN